MTSSELSNYGTALPSLPTPIANDGDRRYPIIGGNNNTDTQTSIKFGLPAKMSEPIDQNGIPVPRQDINGIYNLLSRVVHYLMSGGRIPYLAAQSTAINGYPKDAEVLYNGNIYKSLVDSNTSLPTDTTKWKLINFLPISGGTIGGSIISDIENIIVRSINNGLLTLSGSADGKGARLILRGSSAIHEKVFSLIAGDMELTGYPNGKLLWGAKHIVRSINGINADVNGNVQINKRTLIFNSQNGIASGDITTTQPWTNFKYLIVIGSDGNRIALGNYIVDVDAMFDVIFNKNKIYILYSTVSEYWDILGASSGTTNNLLKTYSGNCIIWKIYGTNSL